MKKIFTPFLMMLLMFVMSAQTYAQKFYDRASDPSSEIVDGQTYALAVPWTGDAKMLCGNRGTEILIEDAVYVFEKAGANDAGDVLYRLKQVSTGEYLEDPDLSNGVVSMTKAIGRAFVFTAKVATGMEATYNNENNQNVHADGWDAYIEQLNEDPTAVYDNQSTEGFSDAFVLCNKNYATSGRKVFCMSSDPSWSQWAAQRIFHLYEATKCNAYNDLCQGVPYLCPNGVDGLFVEGSAPGQVAPELVQELLAAFNEASQLISDDSREDAVYTAALERLNKALKACEENVKPVVPGYYVLDNFPEAGRPQYAGTDNACMLDTLGELHWNGFNKPEKMTVAGAAYIWEVIPAEGEKGGWYLRNYGTKRYAGSLNANYQCVPSTEEPKQIFDINYRHGECFSLDMRGQNANFPALHADQNAGWRIVIWTSEANASWWRFLPVDESELKDIESQLDQVRINKEAKALVKDVKASYSRGFTYSSSATHDGVYQEDNMGLVTEADQYFSFTPETTEGKLEDNGLLDNDQKTIFHSCWSSNAYKGMAHNLGADLKKEYAAIAVKYSRRNKGNDGCAKIVHVYASNDTTGGNWVEQGYMTLTYTYESNETYTEAGVPNFTGIASIGFDAPYRFVRFDVEHTYSDASAQSGIYFNFSEFRVYEAQYDASQSLIEAVPKAIVDQLLASKDKVEKELENGAVAQESLDELQAAYDEFMKNFPDPQKVKDLMAEAKAQAAAAVEGDGLGYFEEGAADELNAVIAEVEASVKDVMTVEEVNTAIAKLNAGLEVFNSKFIVPGNGELYYIKCATSSEQEGSAANSYLFAQNSEESQIKYGLPDDMGNKPNYLWKSIKFEDGSYAFQNVATGTFLGNPKKNNVRVNMSMTADSLGIRSAKVEGLFNFVCSENVFFNAQPGTNNLVTWNSASGTDNSAFAIVPMEDCELGYWDGSSINYNVTGQPAVVSFPLAITGDCAGGQMYKVLGLKEGKLKLGLYASSDVLPAGTPFIFVPEEGSESSDFYGPDNVDLKAIEYDLVGKNQNGLQATIQSEDEIIGGGILFEGNVILAVEGDEARANSGYFNAMPTATEEEGDLEMDFPENISTAIEEVIANTNAKSGVYSLTGVKVRNNNNVKGLPKGLYIVGGQKVLVK